MLLIFSPKKRSSYRSFIYNLTKYTISLLHFYAHSFAGYAVATSASGYTVAVGSPKHTSLISPNPPKDAGRVRIYRYNPKQDGWKKVGQDIEGQSDGDEFGSSISLNDDGNIIAIGAPNCDRMGKREVGCVKVYELRFVADPDNGEDEEVWFEIGDTIVGDKSFDHFGTSIDLQMSYDLITDQLTYFVVIGAPDSGGDGQEAGLVYLYKFTNVEDQANLDWKREVLITDDDPFPLAKFGASVSMTSDSKMIAIGAPKHGGSRAGAVRIFRKDENDHGDWKQMDLPNNMNTHYSGENCGASVSIDPSGQYIAFGCPTASIGYGKRTGRVKILQRNTAFNGTITWSNEEIVGEDQDNLFGTSVMLSTVINGHVFLIVGAPENARLGDGNEIIENSGHVQVYYNTDEGEFTQAGLDIEGLDRDDMFGSSVAISGEGHVVVSGAPDGGYAKIFKLDYTAPPTPGPTSYVNEEELEKKRENSVWIVFIISAFSFVALAMSFALMKSLRRRRQFKNVRTNEDNAVVAEGENNMDLAIQRTTVTTSIGEVKDLI